MHFKAVFSNYWGRIGVFCVKPIKANFFIFYLYVLYTNYSVFPKSQENLPLLLNRVNFSNVSSCMIDFQFAMYNSMNTMDIILS